ncbi:MAG: NusG domain II-containing protein [Lachnospiraceae bacterium]
MKKNDWMVIAIIVCIAGIWFGIHQVNGKKDGGYVTVTVDGEKQGTYSLSKEQTISIHHTNTLVIHEGKADMTKATCPDKVCVHQKSISRKGESLICLPNKVIVEVTGGKNAKLDAVTN